MTAEDLRIKARLAFKNKSATLRSEYLKKIRASLDDLNLDVPLLTLIEAFNKRKQKINKSSDNVEMTSMMDTKTIKPSQNDKNKSYATETSQMTNELARVKKKKNTTKKNKIEETIDSRLISEEDVFKTEISVVTAQLKKKPVKKRRGSLLGLVDSQSTEEASIAPVKKKKRGVNVELESDSSHEDNYTIHADSFSFYKF